MFICILKTYLKKYVKERVQYSVFPQMEMFPFKQQNLRSFSLMSEL